METLVLASGNRNKLEEMKAILTPLSVQVVSQDEYGVPAAEETGTTFVENAIIKARNAAQHTGLPAIADDSGLEVDALNGAPGVFSARFSGADASDNKNNALLIEMLGALPEAARSARYRAVLVLMRHEDDAMPMLCEGTWEGQIVLQPRGDNGFGYDPHFLLPELGKTAAELDAAQKNRLSHRGQALRALIARLRDSPIRQPTDP